MKSDGMFSFQVLLLRPHLESHFIIASPAEQVSTLREQVCSMHENEERKDPYLCVAAPT